MRWLLGLTIISIGCTAITNFAGYHFSDAVDLASELGDLGEDAAPANLDLASKDASNPDLKQPMCPPPAACCAALPCTAGGCCVQGACFPSGTETTPGMICIDGAEQACGMPGNFCCGQNVCHNQGCCVGGRCVANSSGLNVNSCSTALGSCMGGACQGVTSRCGGPGDGCCPGGNNSADFCSESGVVCVNNQCEQCALLPGGQFCCAGGWCPSGQCCDESVSQCVANGDNCSNSQGQCSNGGCNGGKCGKLSQACCGGGVGCTQPLTRCSAAQTCDACGGLDQRCCDAKFCSEGYVCDGNDKCKRCGGAAQLCCQGALCSPNYRCGTQTGVCL